MIYVIHTTTHTYIYIYIYVGIYVLKTYKKNSIKCLKLKKLLFIKTIVYLLYKYYFLYI